MPKPTIRSKPPTEAEKAKAKAARAHTKTKVFQRLLAKERNTTFRLEAKIRRLEAKLFSLGVKLDHQKRISGTRKRINEHMKAELKSLKNNRDLAPMEILYAEEPELLLLEEKRD